MEMMESGLELGQGESIRDWFDKGDAALSEEKPSEAVECFDMVLRVDPFSAKAYTKLSHAYWKQGRTEDALNSMMRALELEPNDQETILQCSRIFRELGHEDDCREVLNSYLERNPGNESVRSELKLLDRVVDADALKTAEFFREQGELEFSRGNTGHATACFEMALENNPRLAIAHNNLGVIEFEKGDLESALQHFYRALDLQPEDPEILCNSARALARADEVDSSMDLYKMYLSRCPDDEAAWEEYERVVYRSAATEWGVEGLPVEVADIYTSAARQLMDAGDLTGAMEAVQRALKIRPGTAESLYILAALHNAFGQRNEAVEILERILATEPSHTDSDALLKSIRNGAGNGLSN